MATEAQIRASRANGAKSRGPVTSEGKETSRANSYKHGLSGAGIVVDESEAFEVDRRCHLFVRDLKPSNDVGLALAHHAARMSVRLDRCAKQEAARLNVRIHQAKADFVPPAGVDAVQAERLRVQEGNLALLDTSKEAILARKYEAAAERGFFRALKELRLIDKPARGVEASAPAKAVASTLGSLLQTEKTLKMVQALGPKPAPIAPKAAPIAPKTAPISPKTAPISLDLILAEGREARFDVPFTVGRRR